MKGSKAKLASTDSIPFPNEYVGMLLNEFSHRAFDEQKAPQFKGKWRSDLLKKPDDYPVDLEIGTGNGYHFAHYTATRKDRTLLGLEVKYKPLVQTIRRALNAGADSNAYMMRYNAYMVDDLFEPNELNNVIIHHPDPWPKKKHWKHRLIQDDFLKRIYPLMRTGCVLDFKTDNKDYFNWSEEIFKNSEFEMIAYTRDLHNSEWASENFKTHFEKIFLAKGQPIYFLRMKKG